MGWPFFLMENSVSEDSLCRMTSVSVRIRVDEHAPSVGMPAWVGSRLLAHFSAQGWQYRAALRKPGG